MGAYNSAMKCVTTTGGATPKLQPEQQTEHDSVKKAGAVGAASEPAAKKKATFSKRLKKKAKFLGKLSRTVAVKVSAATTPSVVLGKDLPPTDIEVKNKEENFDDVREMEDLLEKLDITPPIPCSDSFSPNTSTMALLSSGDCTDISGDGDESPLLFEIDEEISNTNISTTTSTEQSLSIVPALRDFPHQSRTAAILDGSYASTVMEASLSNPAVLVHWEVFVAGVGFGCVTKGTKGVAMRHPTIEVQLHDGRQVTVTIQCSDTMVSGYNVLPVQMM